MRIGRPLLKLPVRFCGDTLAREVSSLPVSAWSEHPEKFDGNIAAPLVAPGGAITDQLSGPMAPTPLLSQCPYILDIMRTLDSTWGRSRLMGLKPGAAVPQHVDIHYYWRTHFRVHIPAITNSKVAFTCAGETVHMQAGECWLLDSFFNHSVVNAGTETRVHLVLDTVGSASFWDLIEAALDGNTEAQLVNPGEAPNRDLAFEQVNTPLVMSPWEMKTHLAYVGEWTDDQPGRAEIFKILDRFVMAWEGTWGRYGISESALADYLRHLNDVRRALDTLDGPPVMMRNKVKLVRAVAGFILANAIAPAVLQRAQLRTPMGAQQCAPFRLSA